MEPLRIMVVGAHPDDDEIHAGGYALGMIKAGHRVRFVSMTNGSAGHQSLKPAQLAARRKAETEAVSRVSGVEYTVMPIDDGYLEVNCKNRDMLIAEIRGMRPHLILTHRPNDYHPDHRNTGVMVQDASYLVMVPNVCPSAPALDFQPVIAYTSDSFTLPTPFCADVVVATDDVLEGKMRMLHCHKSQFYEWLPWVGHYAEGLPEDDEERYQWLKERRIPYFAKSGDRFRDKLIEKYGEMGKSIVTCEGYQISEYGDVPDAEGIKKLFPF